MEIVCSREGPILAIGPLADPRPLVRQGLPGGASKNSMIAARITRFSFAQVKAIMFSKEADESVLNKMRAHRKFESFERRRSNIAT
ncbi:hypothetical protein [Massilia sp. Mn16-1_5]|uniref:hypothetical protein n=1 Tax=Massilia sp. Mn16-1_5 TaxID=2079199 RepID=UPI00109E626B|nr:hypothetical protein [Massilia sp. Mn16-1_5]